MNTRSIIIGTCLVTGLSGLGYLVWYLYGDTEDTDSRADLPDMEQTVAPQHHHKPTKQKPSKTVTRPPIPHKPPQTATRTQVSHRSQPKGDEFPLRLGSKGKRVERLQVWLMRNFGWTGKITNVFDKKTESLLKKFLKKTQLDQTTYNRMKMGKPVHLQPVIPNCVLNTPISRVRDCSGYPAPRQRRGWSMSGKPDRTMPQRGKGTPKKNSELEIKLV